MTEDALAMVKEAIAAVDPYQAVRRVLMPEKDDDDDGIRIRVQHSSSSSNNNNNKTAYFINNINKDFDSILLLAFGKASSAMARAVVDCVQTTMPQLPIKGVVVTKDGHATEDERRTLLSQQQQPQHDIVLLEASHPVPDERSVSAATTILEAARAASTSTLTICCISGGGSALFCGPAPPLTLRDLQQTNQVLLESGMPITKINVVRKRLEVGKGGRLAAAVHPSPCVTLVLSDVLGDPLDLIASGPTVPDESTFEEAWEIVQKYDIESQLPAAVTTLLREGLAGSVEDTPSSKSHPAFFASSNTVLVGNNELAVRAAAQEAKRRGYHAVILGTMIQGEAKDVAGVYVAMAQQLLSQHYPATTTTTTTDDEFALTQRPAALIAGGETTVTILNSSSSSTTSGVGKGGRNQELALAAAVRLHDWRLRNVVLASAGTDGTDGPTDAAGAVVDGGTVGRLSLTAADAVQALQNHDSYTYLKQQEPEDGHCPLIMTGPTGTNVADVCVILVK